MPETIARKGLMFVLSSPSGAGKTTLSRALLASDPDIALSVSATTRTKRPGEVEGEDYRFVTEEDFARMVEDGAFLEHAVVFGNRYGTPKEPVDRILAQGKDVLFDIDWQGAEQVAKRAKDDLVRVFILPPSIGALEKRLKTRAQDSDEVVAARMAKAREEISHWREYDYVVINEDVETCLKEIKAILAAERLRLARRTGLARFVDGLRRK